MNWIDLATIYAVAGAAEDLEGLGSGDIIHVDNRKSGQSGQQSGSPEKKKGKCLESFDTVKTEAKRAA